MRTSWRGDTRHWANANRPTSNRRVVGWVKFDGWPGGTCVALLMDYTTWDLPVGVYVPDAGGLALAYAHTVWSKYQRLPMTLPSFFPRGVTMVVVGTSGGGPGNHYQSVDVLAMTRAGFREVLAVVTDEVLGMHPYRGHRSATLSWSDMRTSRPRATIDHVGWLEEDVRPDDEERTTTARNDGRWTETFSWSAKDGRFAKLPSRQPPQGGDEWACRDWPFVCRDE